MVTQRGCYTRRPVANLGGIRLQGALPTWREKRDILADPASPTAGVLAIGKILEGAGQLEDAADYFAKAAAKAELERLRKQACEVGDFFLWSRTCKHLGALPLPADEARALAARAEATRRPFFARMAFLAIGDAEAVARVEKLIPTALPVKPPEDAVATAVAEAEAAEAAKAHEHDGHAHGPPAAPPAPPAA